jgi:hypothetical protein
LLFQFLIPVIQIGLFCLCIGREPFNIKFGIVNNETIYKSDNNGAQMYINKLSNETFEKRYLNWTDAYHMTKKGDLWGFIDLSVNFTQDTITK